MKYKKLYYDEYLLDISNHKLQHTLKLEFGANETDQTNYFCNLWYCVTVLTRGLKTSDLNSLKLTANKI